MSLCLSYECSLTYGFYDGVKEGIVIFKAYKSFSFCRNGLVLDGSGK
jgi:hypothetical protein